MHFLRWENQSFTLMNCTFQNDLHRNPCIFCALRFIGTERISIYKKCAALSQNISMRFIIPNLILAGTFHNIVIEIIVFMFICIFAYICPNLVCLDIIR